MRRCFKMSCQDSQPRSARLCLIVQPLFENGPCHLSGMSTSWKEGSSWSRETPVFRQSCTRPFFWGALPSKPVYRTFLFQTPPQYPALAGCHSSTEKSSSEVPEGRGFGEENCVGRGRVAGEKWTQKSKAGNGMKLISGFRCCLV